MNRRTPSFALALGLLICGVLIGASLEEFFDLLRAYTAWLPITAGVVGAVVLLRAGRGPGGSEARHSPTGSE